MNELHVAFDYSKKIKEQASEIDMLMGSVSGIMEYFHTLESKYNVPLAIHFARDMSPNAHQRSGSVVTEVIEKIITGYLVRHVGKDYSCKFLTIRGMTFSILKGDLEVSRFSLMSREYAFMQTVIKKEDYIKNQKIQKSQEAQWRADINELNAQLKELSNYNENYWAILKDVKNIGHFIDVIVNKDKIKKAITSSILQKEASIEWFEKEIERLREMDEFNEKRFKESEFIIRYLTENFFNDFIYTETKRDKFYI